MRRLVFPLGMSLRAPADYVGTKVAKLLMEPTTTRDRLVEYMYRSTDESDPIGVLDHALKAVIATEGLEHKLRKAQRDGKNVGLTAMDRLDDAVAKGLISKEEHAAVTRARQLKRQVIMVDDFDGNLENPDLASPPASSSATAPRPAPRWHRSRPRPRPYWLKCRAHRSDRAHLIAQAYVLPESAVAVASRAASYLHLLCMKRCQQA